MKIVFTVLFDSRLIYKGPNETDAAAEMWAVCREFALTSSGCHLPCILHVEKFEDGKRVL